MRLAAAQTSTTQDTAPALPYHQILAAAAQLLCAVQEGRALDGALQNVPEAEQAAARAVVSQALRVYGAAQWLLQQYVRKPLPAPLTALLLVSLAQCPPLSQLQPPTRSRSVHTVLHQCGAALRLDARLRKWQGLQGVVNGVLRSVQRDADAHLQTLAQSVFAAAQRDAMAVPKQAGATEAAATEAGAAIATHLRHVSAVPRYLAMQLPVWWLQQLQIDGPREWAQHLRASNAVPALHVRVHRADRAKTLASLQAAQVAFTPLGLEGLCLADTAPTPTLLPGFDTGALSVQDGAAQLAAPLLCAALQTSHALRARPASQPLRLLDACAAPGGKTLHLLQTLAQQGPAAQLLALDKDAVRLERVNRDLARAATTLHHAQPTLTWQCRVADAAQPQTWWDGQSLDGILLDAPCSGSGVVRRHPDMPLLRRNSDIANLAAQQARLLAALWPLLRMGGVLLYATCSVFHQECEAQIATFIQQNRDADCWWQWRLWAGTAQQFNRMTSMHAIRADSLQEIRDNPPHDHDGFYYALLHKIR